MHGLGVIKAMNQRAYEAWKRKQENQTPTDKEQKLQDSTNENSTPHTVEERFGFYTYNGKYYVKDNRRGVIVGAYTAEWQARMLVDLLEEGQVYE